MKAMKWSKVLGARDEPRSFDHWRSLKAVDVTADLFTFFRGRSCQWDVCQKKTHQFIDHRFMVFCVAQSFLQLTVHFDQYGWCCYSACWWCHFIFSEQLVRSNILQVVSLSVDICIAQWFFFWIQFCLSFMWILTLAFLVGFHCEVKYVGCGLVRASHMLKSDCRLSF